MIDMTRDQKIERLKMFLENKTYAYIKDSFNYNFNGFIRQIDEHKILFKDDKLDVIPISIDDIKDINYSTKTKPEGDVLE